MRRRLRFDRWLCAMSLIVGMGISGGCQTWQTSAVIPSFGATSGERQVVRQAKNDPFPSPRDVGITMSK